MEEKGEKGITRLEGKGEKGIIRLEEKGEKGIKDGRRNRKKRNKRCKEK